MPDAPTRRGNFDLVIVESPAKAKTINKYLGSSYRVLASYGHVRDLPPSGKVKGEDVVGINIGGGWVPRYQTIKRDDKGGGSKRRGAEDILAELKREADKANRVLLATDPDREGESIAWHLEQALELEPDRTYRVTFNEITKTAVQNALRSPGKIDMGRVQAQEARRVLDRVVGYPLSNLLGKKVTRGLSAGRVQSVAVKLIVDRELEIEAFKTEEYWKVTALLSPEGAGVKWAADPAKSKVYAKKKGDAAKGEAADAAADEPEKDTEAPEGGEAAGAGAGGATPGKGGIPAPPAGSFLAGLDRWDGKEPALKTEADADAVVAALQNVPFVVTKVDQKDRPERPQAPFTTSTLQQQASIRLRFAVSRTMQTAQRLYEGIDLGGEGPTALITYMRTDSTRVSADALNMVRDFIGTDARLGQRYLPDRPNNYASGKSAQEAHEAIRPTDVSMTPQRAAAAGLAGDQLKLYDLIWRRFVASQMTPAIFAVTTVEVTAGRGLFKTTGKIEKFDGYRRVFAQVGGKQEDVTLPPLSDGMKLDRLDLFETQHFTQPPPRFNEASLVKALEKEGIGRPSTYATIISTIERRGYVELKDRRFFATDIGKLVTKLLVDHFPRVMDVKFTSHFEEELDEIETGKCQYKEVLTEFWDPFKQALDVAQTAMPAQKGVGTGETCPQCGKHELVKSYSSKTGRDFIGCPGWKDDPPCKYIKPREGEPDRPQAVETDFKCPTCGKNMIQRHSPKAGTFLGCSGYPECKTTMNIGADGQPVVSAAPTEHKCDKCGAAMIKREGRRGPFLGCSAYPKCKNVQELDAQGNPVKPVDTGVACDKCNSPMVVKRGPRGPFLSCSGYPKCRNAKPMPADLKEKLKDALPAPAPKPTMPQVEIDQTCPECDSPMRLQKSRFGGRYFLGCTKYPKCKGTAKLSAELEAKVQEAAQATAEA